MDDGDYYRVRVDDTSLEQPPVSGWSLARDGKAPPPVVTFHAVADQLARGNLYAIRQAGGIPPLVELVKSGSDAQKEKAAGALENLADNNANRDAIREEGGIPPLVALVRSGSPAQKKKAAGALERLADNEQNRIEIPVSCAGADIMHGNNTSYWRQHEACAESVFGEVAHCVFVCWFQIIVSATLPRGTYEVSWCVRSAGNWGNEAFSFSLRPAEESVLDAAATVCSPDAAMHPDEIQEALVESGTTGWSLLRVGTVEVRALTADVQAKIWKHSGSWVGPLSFDYVHFLRVS